MSSQQTMVLSRSEQELKIKFEEMTTALRQ